MITPTLKNFISLSPRLDTTPNQSPCAEVIDRAERVNRTNRHENLGFLSHRAGFMPVEHPSAALPPRYRVWDDLAAALPVLCRDQTLRAAVDRLPVLPADAQALPDAHLQRASTLLSIVAHAYVHADMSGPTSLPPCLETPWTEVSQRLGRPIPSLSYIDLIAYNWRIADSIDKTFQVENLSLLVPTVDNAEERVFYLTQAEILSRATPLLKGVVDAQRAVFKNDPSALKHVIDGMSDTLAEIGRKSLMKIAPNQSRATHVDPVVWAKSVAPLAVPLRSDVAGPGGTASPLFHLMDNFIGRTDYHAFLGEEAQRIRAAYPPHWQDVIKAAGVVPMAAFIEGVGDPDLTRRWEAMKEKYRGSMGLLGLHRRKVFAYLPMAFKVGRSATIAGFRGHMGEAEWIKVHAELEKSRQERYGSRDVEAPPYSLGAPSARPKAKVAISTLVEHSSRETGHWFAANGRVFDASKYMRLHPGGDKILAGSSGRDVTADLHAVSHFQEPAIAAKMEKFAIGELDVRQFANAQLSELYDFAVAMAYKIADLVSTFDNDITFLQSRLTSAEAATDETAQKRRFWAAAQQRLGSQYVPAIAMHAQAVAQAVGWDAQARFERLTTKSGSAAAVQEAQAKLALCKAQAVLLLKVLECVAPTASALTSAQRHATQHALARIAAALEAL